MCDDCRNINVNKRLSTQQRIINLYLASMQLADEKNCDEILKLERSYYDTNFYDTVPNFMSTSNLSPNSVRDSNECTYFKPISSNQIGSNMSNNINDYFNGTNKVTSSDETLWTPWGFPCP
ncbi:hypothetical protein AB6A40_005402 [Gnathostoma spinigerum]|uniref:Uncharacterized protein n=1 Tax=Gnathostoma spinigerum TaxID=75299 RepID=A0ABD6EFH1_9BILA